MLSVQQSRSYMDQTADGTGSTLCVSNWFRPSASTSSCHVCTRRTSQGTMASCRPRPSKPLCPRSTRNSRKKSYRAALVRSSRPVPHARMMRLAASSSARPTSTTAMRRRPSGKTQRPMTAMSSRTVTSPQPMSARLMVCQAMALRPRVAPMHHAMHTRGFDCRQVCTQQETRICVLW